MKPQLKLSFLLALPLFIFGYSSCSKNDLTLPGQGQMTAIVSGEPWASETVMASIVQGKFAISGTAANGSTISLRLDGFGEGTYDSYPGSSNAYVWQYTQNALGYTSIAPMGLGRVFVEEINEMDSLISGSFFFLAQEPASQDTISVVEGVFTDVQYQIGAVAVGDNYLNVKINDTPWEAVMVTGLVNGGKLLINGTSADVTRTVSLHLPSGITPGTYNLGSPFSADYGGQYNRDSNTFLIADSGTLTITQHDKINKIIEGTFHFEASEFVGSASADLTEGAFYVAY